MASSATACRAALVRLFSPVIFERLQLLFSRRMIRLVTFCALPSTLPATCGVLALFIPPSRGRAFPRNLSDVLSAASSQRLWFAPEESRSERRHKSSTCPRRERSEH